MINSTTIMGPPRENILRWSTDIGVI